MQFAVPSKGRGAYKTNTKNILPNSVYYVPYSERDDYKKSHGGIIIDVPDKVKGITATRNFILNNCNERHVVMVDDDVENCGYHEFYETKTKRRKIREEYIWIDECEKLINMCEELGYKLFGLATQSDRMTVYPYKPFIFQTYVLGSFIGHINDGSLYYDESFVLKEDYEICLRHIQKYGGVLGCRFLHWECNHLIKNGGCKDYRTIEMESKAISKLIDMYPNMIRKIKRKGSEYNIQLEF